jgi:hypothetical protein
LSSFFRVSFHFYSKSSFEFETKLSRLPFVHTTNNTTRLGEAREETNTATAGERARLGGTLFFFCDVVVRFDVVVFSRIIIIIIIIIGECLLLFEKQKQKQKYLCREDDERATKIGFKEERGAPRHRGESVRPSERGRLKPRPFGKRRRRKRVGYSSGFTPHRGEKCGWASPVLGGELSRRRGDRELSTRDGGLNARWKSDGDGFDVHEWHVHRRRRVITRNPARVDGRRRGHLRRRALREVRVGD